MFKKSWTHNKNAHNVEFLRKIVMPDLKILEEAVFGVPADSPYGHKDLWYVYDDRLDYTRWQESLQSAKCVYAEPKTARFYEIGLSLYYGKPVNLQHIILGVNRSNGFSYLIFGFEK